MGKAPSQVQSFRAGELAIASGVSTDTLRHYVRKAVLAAPPRAPNGYREYPLQALERVRVVRRALAVGFTLDELAQLLRVRDQGGAPCKQVRALATAKLPDLEARLIEMQTVRDELRATLKDWDIRLARVSNGGRAELLEAFARADSLIERPPHSLRPAWRKRKRSKSEMRNDK